MKKAFLFIAALAMSTMMWADVTVDSILLKGFAGSESTSYVSELLTGSSQNGITVAASNFNPSTSQIKGNQTSATGNFYIYNTDAYPAAITKIEIIAKIDANNYFKNNMYAATGTTSQAEVTDVAAGAAWNLETASWTFDEADGVTYFKLYSNEKFTNGSVKEAKVVVTYGGEPAPQKEIVDVRVTDEPTKKEYFVGESFDPAGLTVTAIYDDASTEDVTSKATWTIEPATFTEASESASVSVKAEFNKVKSKPRTITGIVVTEKPAPVEKITTIAGITSGKKYYIGATTGGNDFYFFVDGDMATESIKGTAVENVADAAELKFIAVTDGWTLQFNSGKYLGLKNSKDNGAVQVVEEVVVWTIEEVAEKGLLKLSPNDSYSLQKNNSGTQFGSYANTQTYVWLTPADGQGTDIREAMINANVRKAMVNGRLIIIKGEKAFDLQGRIVK